MEPLKGCGGGKNMGFAEKIYFSKLLHPLAKLLRFVAKPVVSSDKHCLMFNVPLAVSEIENRFLNESWPQESI